MTIDLVDGELRPAATATSTAAALDSETPPATNTKQDWSTTDNVPDKAPGMP